MFSVSGRNAPPEVETNRPSPQPGKEPGETSSVTEDDNDSEDDSDSREAQYRCSHCFATSKSHTIKYPLTLCKNYHFAGSKDWQPGGKDRQLLCWDCRAHYKKTNELPPLTAPPATGNTPPTGNIHVLPTHFVNFAYIIYKIYETLSISESPDASPQRMRTRNKAAKEQTTNRARPKRGGTETPEPKTPIKQNNNNEKITPNQPPSTPGKKKGKTDKPETPNKNRKRQQESRVEENEMEEKDLGLLKKKRERAESPSSVTTDSETVNEDVENTENENDTADVPPPSSTAIVTTPLQSLVGPSYSNFRRSKFNKYFCVFQVTTSIAPTLNSNNNIISQETPSKPMTKADTLEPQDIKPSIQTNAPSSAGLPVIQSTKHQTTANMEPMPLNVSIRLPDDLNERKNLIKRNLDNVLDMKDMKYNPESMKYNSDNMKINPEAVRFAQQEYKKEQQQIKKPEIQPKMEKEIKEEMKESIPPQPMPNVPEKPFKTELIIPKVHTIDKIKEEMDSSNEAINMNPMGLNTNFDGKDENIYKESIFMPQSKGIKEPISFGMKDPPLMNHLQPKHGLNLKEPQMEKHKEQIINMNHSNYLSDKKQDPFGYQSSQGSNKDTNPTTAATINSVNNTVIKLEPRDEPMELTNQNRNEMPQPYGSMSQPLNIPQVIPMSQQIPPSLRQSSDSHYEEEKKLEKLERPERLDRPDRIDRSDRSEMGPMTSSSIGQPPLPSLMQSSNLVTIGGSQAPQINHYGFMTGVSPFSHPQSPRNADKAQSHMQQGGSQGQNQNEPQNLKIKQEIPDMSSSQSSQSLPPNHLSGLNTFTQNVLPPGPGQTSHNMTILPPSSQSLSATANLPTSGGYIQPPSHLPGPPMADPLQSLRDVKVNKKKNHLLLFIYFIYRC